MESSVDSLATRLTELSSAELEQLSVALDTEAAGRVANVLIRAPKTAEDGAELTEVLLRAVRDLLSQATDQTTKQLGEEVRDILGRFAAQQAARR